MTINEWLSTDLAKDIWKNKYQYNDETFDEWLDRVSNGDETIKKLIKEKKFLFGGRILANRGLNKLGKKVTYSNCFAKNTKVLTQHGYKNIQDIQIGEKVLTHTGLFQNVDNVLSREYTGNMFKLKTYMSEYIYCTNEHPFLTQDGWKKTKDLTLNDYIKFPKYNNLNNSDFNIKLENYYDLMNNQFIEYNGEKIRISTKCNTHNGAETINSSNWIKNNIIIDKDMKYLFGRWLGDGSITKRKGTEKFSIFQIVFNIKEIESFNKCKSILEEKLGLTTTSRIEESQSTLILRVENALFSEFIYKTFGNGCENKFIYNNQLLNSMDLVYGILDSDALITADGQIRLSLKNKKLLYQIKGIIEKYGIPCSDIKKITNNKIFYIYQFRINKYISCNFILSNLSKIYEDSRILTTSSRDTKYIIKNDEVFVRIKELTSINLADIDSKTIVYNLSIAQDNSYIVDTLVTHNCYVMSPPEDNIESIFDTAKYLARTFSYSGGCGVDISKLRPSGMKVHNAAETTTGSISFMDLYSKVTEIIGAKGRRGALMLSILCTHPDVINFIDIKNDLNKVTKANISIRILDDFMKAVKEDKEWTLYFKSKDTNEEITQVVKAREIFDKLCYNNWNMAEPGMLFWDRITSWNLLSEDKEFEFAGTNPCAKFLWLM